MKHILTLSHDKIFAKAELLTSYQSAKDGTDFDACRIKKADKELIDMYYDESVEELTQMFLHYIAYDVECPCTEIEQEDWNVVLSIPDFPSVFCKSLDNLAHDVAASYAVGRWLAMLMSKQQAGSFEAATLIASQHEDFKDKLRHILNERKKPVRLKSNPY